MSSTALTTRRSVYADRLREFSEFALGDEHVFQHRGRWSSFFGQRIGSRFDGSVVVDVGCSDASFLCRIAAKHPSTAFVGLDWRCRAIYEGAQRVADLRLNNVALLRARAQDVLRVFGGREIDEIWIFHPDPCDREVELKHRLIGEPFLRAVHSVLRDSRSVLSFKTDHPGYYQWVLSLFGLPEPDWFQAARDAGAWIPPAPRVRARDVMCRNDLPPACRTLRERFDVTTSTDFWSDAAALARTSTRCFAGERTAFECRFTKKRLPIYFIELIPARGV